MSNPRGHRVVASELVVKSWRCFTFDPRDFFSFNCLAGNVGLPHQPIRTQEIQLPWPYNCLDNDGPDEWESPQIVVVKVKKKCLNMVNGRGASPCQWTLLPSRCRSSRWPMQQPDRSPGPSSETRCGQYLEIFSTLVAWEHTHENRSNVWSSHRNNG